MSREKFEQLCVERMAEWRGAGNTLDDNGSPLTVEALCWKDENGNYGVRALNAAWWGYRMAHRVPDGFVLMPAQLTDAELTFAQGELMDVDWSATECFAARLHRLYEITRVRVEAALKKETE